MIKRGRFIPPKSSNLEVSALGRAIAQYLDSLNNKNSLTLDSVTGLDNTPVGANTASTGKFTTLSATGLADLSGAAAGQIKFPATQNASANANTLDDYAEGTYTPTVTASSGTITTVSGAAGSYTKIGRLVHVTVDATITTAGTGSGFLQFSLPFTPTKGAMGAGRELGGAGFICSAQINATVATLFIIKYDGTSPIASGNQIRASATFAV